MTFATELRRILRTATGTLTGIVPGSVGEQMLARLWPGATGPPPTPGTRERLRAFADTPWLHAVADKVASQFASVEWRLYVVRRQQQGPAINARLLQRAGPLARTKLLQDTAAAGDLVQLDTHLMLEALDAANPYQTGPAMRKTWMLHYDLTGDAFLMKERNALGAPVALWPLPPHWIVRTPTPAMRFYRVAFRGWQGEIPDTELLWISNPNPENPYGRGVGMAQALADEIETDEYAAKTTRQTFFNGARPDFLVYPKEGEGRLAWSDPQTARLEAEWRADHQGFWRVAKPKFLTREVGVYEFDQTNMRNLQMVPIRQFERDTIIQTYGIPPEILGINESSNRATIQAASYIMARFVVVPRLEVFRAALQERLVPEYDARLIVDYASPVEDDAALGLEAAKAMPSVLTANEWRALSSHPPIEDGTGDLHPLPSTLRFAPLDSEPPAPVPFGGAPMPAGNGNGPSPPKRIARDIDRRRAKILFDAGASDHQGLLASLRLSQEAASALALLGGEPAETLHVTLGFCGDVAKLGDVVIAAAIVALDAVSAESPILAGRVGGVGRFTASPSSEGRDVIYAAPDVPGLAELRNRVAMALTGAGAPPLANHGWTPHITLAYIEPGARFDRDVPAVSLVFTSVTLSVGEKTAEFLLRGGVTPTPTRDLSKLSTDELLDLRRLVGKIDA